MHLKALVVNPWVTDFKLYDEWMHPAGLYFLVDFLDRNNAETFFFNCLARPADAKRKRHGTGVFQSRDFPKPPLYGKMKRRYKLYGAAREEFLSFLMSIPKPDMIFIGTSMTYWIEGVRETIAVVSQVFPDVPLTIGGTSAMLMPQVFKNTGASLHVFGASLFDPNALKNTTIPFLSNMASLPYDATMIKGLAMLTDAFHGPVLTSFGCPFDCSYCASGLLHKRHVIRPAEAIIREMSYLQSRFGVMDFACYDDALLYLPDLNFFPLMNAIRDRGIVCRFHTPNGLHVRWISSEILDSMIKAGFRTLRLGYESGNLYRSEETKNKTSRKELSQKAALIKQAGFDGKDIGVYVMSGLAGQTPLEVIEDIAFVASLSLRVKPVFLSPVPGTPVFTRYAKLYPGLLQTPLFHNDSFFITQLPGWDETTVQHIMDVANKYNAAL